MAEHLAIGSSQEADRVDVLAPAVFVRDPASFRPAVIEVKHGGDGVDAQAIDTVAVEPEQRVGGQEIADFDAAIVVDQGAPVEMPSLARILVFVEAGPVEMCETM